MAKMDIGSLHVALVRKREDGFVVRVETRYSEDQGSAPGSLHDWGQVTWDPAKCRATVATS